MGWWNRSSSRKSKRSDVGPEEGEPRETGVCEVCDFGESDREESSGIEDTTRKLLIAVADSRDSILRVQERLNSVQREFKVNGEQAAYLKQSLLWGLRDLPLLDPHSNCLSLLQEQASISRSAAWRAECNKALLFCANTLGELSRTMRIGEALVVDCIGSTKDWPQLVVLESILPPRRKLVSEEPLWSPFYLVLRDFLRAHTLLDKAIGEFEDICECSDFSPEVAKKAREDRFNHRFNSYKQCCWSHAGKDTEFLLKECKQHVKGNKRSTKSFGAKYMLKKLNFKDQPEPAGGGASRPDPPFPEFLLIDNQDLIGTGSLLGEGSFGFVSEGTWLELPVAVKTMNSVGYTQLSAEVSLLARAEHPHVVRLVGYCSNLCSGGRNKTNGVLMEKMSGDLHVLMGEIVQNKKSVHPEVENHVPFPPPVALDLIIQLAEALRYLHSQRVVHRDIKSKNVLFNPRHLQSELVPPRPEDIGYVTKQLQYYVIKLTDMGLARHKLPGNSLCSTKMQGTTRWMAPEVFNAHPDKYSWPADIYSFGMTSYEIVSGKTPFCDGPSITYERLCAGERPPLPANCQPEIADLIKRCWATDPSRRPDIFEICQELQSCKEALLRRRSVRWNASASCSVITC